jgi:hypothetical protein
MSLITVAVAPGTASATAPAVRIHIKEEAQQAVLFRDIFVTVDYTCAGGTGLISVNVTQDDIVGAGSTAATCDDKTHEADVLVDGDFTPGSAEASAGLSVGNSHAAAFAEVKIKFFGPK